MYAQRTAQTAEKIEKEEDTLNHVTPDTVRQNVIEEYNKNAFILIFFSETYIC